MNSISKVIELFNSAFVQKDASLTVTILDNRAIIQWRFEWGATEKRYVRGVNLMVVNAGVITEALGYVKGSWAE